MRVCRLVPIAALLAASAAGCSEPRREPPAPAPPAADHAGEAARAATATAAPAETAARPPAPVSDEALRESATSRDPFQPSEVKREPPSDGDRPRKSRRYALDELKLVGVVTRIDTPRAMLVGPSGKGWVVTPGELVGKPEVVRGAGDVDTLVSWRVDRIRERDVVLVREDAAGRRVPPETRVLAMRAEPTIDPMQDD